SCVEAFDARGGGEWAGTIWTPDLPTDATLLFFLLAAFLSAPGWNFGAGPGAAQGAGAREGSLVVGAAPARAGAEYLALLSTRPPQGHRATALVGLQLGSPSPQFCVLLKGELLAALSGQHAFWQAAVLFFMTVQRHAGGMLASVSLDVLGLGEVVHPRAHAQNRDAGRASAQGSRADYA
ncbi:hypothetical protein H632_c2443p0, partial [Helicosporidium sp. ATCC 50920]